MTIDLSIFHGEWTLTSHILMIRYRWSSTLSDTYICTTSLVHGDIHTTVRLGTFICSIVALSVSNRFTVSTFLFLEESVSTFHAPHFSVIPSRNELFALCTSLEGIWIIARNSFSLEDTRTSNLESWFTADSTIETSLVLMVHTNITVLVLPVSLCGRTACSRWLRWTGNIVEGLVILTI
jgi:hypothetical protein